MSHSIIAIDEAYLEVDTEKHLSLSIGALKSANVRTLEQVTQNLLSNHNTSFETGSWVQKVADCNIGAPGEAGISMNLVEDATDGDYALRLTSTNHPACVNKQFQVLTSSSQIYFLLGDYKTNEQGEGSVYYQTGSITNYYKNQKGFPATRGLWSPFLIPVTFNNDGNQLIDIYLYADSKGLSLTENTYDNIRLGAYKAAKTTLKFANEQRLILSERIEIQYGESLLTTNDKPQNLLKNKNFSFENGLWTEMVADCNIKAPGEAQAHEMRIYNEATEGNHSLLLSSENHPACTNMHFQVELTPDILYKLSFDFKSIAGNTVKYYYKLSGANGSEYTDTSQTNDVNWTSLTTDFVPHNDSNGIDLYLYAQSDGGLVTTLYDNIQIRPILPSFAPLLQFNHVSNVATSLKSIIHFRAKTPWYWKLNLRNVNDTFMLIMPKRFDPKATLKVKSEVVPEELHFVVNGYSDSWLINPSMLCSQNSLCTLNPDGSYDIELTLEFFPQRWFYLGLLISGTTLLACLGYLAYDFARRRKNRK